MRKILNKNRFLILLISTFTLLIGQMFVPQHWGIYPKTILLFQHKFIGLLLFFESKFLRLLFMCFFIILVFGFLMDRLNPSEYYLYFGIIYSLYFMILTIIVFKKIIVSKEVNNEMLAAIVCGFILLITASSIVFISIESFKPDSFSNIGKGAEKWHNLRYFSFISMITVGYGDILPITILAKNTTALLCMLGHFYTVIVTGIFIGKYINKKLA